MEPADACPRFLGHPVHMKEDPKGPWPSDVFLLLANLFNTFRVLKEVKYLKTLPPVSLPRGCVGLRLHSHTDLHLHGSRPPSDPLPLCCVVYILLLAVLAQYYNFERCSLGTVNFHPSAGRRYTNR